MQLAQELLALVDLRGSQAGEWSLHTRRARGQPGCSSSSCKSLAQCERLNEACTRYDRHTTLLPRTEGTHARRDIEATGRGRGGGREREQSESRDAPTLPSFCLATTTSISLAFSSSMRWTSSVVGGGPERRMDGPVARSGPRQLSLVALEICQ